MIRVGFIILFVLTLAPLTLTGQTLTDIAALQGINFLQSTSDHQANGLSFYDFDNDGWDDLTFASPFDSLRIYRNNNGTFVQMASFFMSAGDMRSVLWVDYDNDGDLDLCTSNYDVGVRMYRNDGNFTFSEVTSYIGISPLIDRTYGISFADPDADGDLDLYVCLYEGAFEQTPSRNLFYENLGNSSFDEIGMQIGIDNSFKASFASTWFDYNNDGNIDLHVVNDRSQFDDALYQNNGGLSFMDVATAVGVENPDSYPMTTSVSDYNNDGYIDIFMSDIANGSGIPGNSGDYRLLENQGGTNFVDMAPVYNIDTTIFAWGGLWADYDNDGYEDLYVATSYIDTLNNPDRTSLLYHNDAGAGFTLMNDSIVGDIVCSSYSAVKGDINNDGFYDIIVQNDNVNPNVLLNSGNGNNYIKITPVGTLSNNQAIGTKVQVYAGGIAQYQPVFCGTGMCAQFSQHMIFGTGTSTTVDSVVLTFPSGIVVRRFDLPVNQSYTISEQIQIAVDMVPGMDTLVLCPGTTATLGVTGYSSYLWNTGSQDSLITVSAAGDYSFNAYNAALDTVYESSSIHIMYEHIPIYQEIVTDPICGVGLNGSIEILFANNQDSLNTIDWSTGDQGTLLDTLPGWYSYTITTPNNCTYSGNATINPTMPFDVQFMTSPETNSDGGTVQFYTFGGTPPFTYVLDNIEITDFEDSLDAGAYQVEITDANGCVVIVDFTINDATTTADINSIEKSGIQVYYAADKIWICGPVSDIETINLFDMSGREIKLRESWTKVNDNCLQNASEISSGLYQLRSEGKTGEHSSALFIH